MLIVRIKKRPIGFVRTKRRPLVFVRTKKRPKGFVRNVKSQTICIIWRKERASRQFQDQFNIYSLYYSFKINSSILYQHKLSLNNAAFIRIHKNTKITIKKTKLFKQCLKSRDFKNVVLLFCTFEIDADIIILFHWAVLKI